jgi:hypothetical protein
MGSKNANVAANLINAIRKNEPDFMDGLAKLSNKFGGKASTILRRFASLENIEFDKIIGAAIRKTKNLPDGEKIFLQGLVTLTQAMGSKSQGAKLIARLQTASADEVGELVATLGKLGNKLGISDKINDPRLAKALRNVFEQEATASISNINKILKDVDTAVAHLTDAANPHNVSNAKAVQAWFNSVAASKVGKFPVLGYFQEMQSVAKRLGNGAQIQVRAQKGKLFIDHKYVEAGKTIVEDSKFMTATADMTAKAKKRIPHMVKYVKEVSSGRADEVRFVVNSVTSKNGLVDAINASKKTNLKNMLANGKIKIEVVSQI